jgi:hypothetical protein
MPQIPLGITPQHTTDARASSFNSKGCLASRPRVKILIAQRRQRQGAGAKCLIAKGCFGRDARPSPALLPHLLEFWN